MAKGIRRRGKVGERMEVCKRERRKRRKNRKEIFRKRRESRNLSRDI